MGNPQYYEGILQLRNCTEEAILFVRDRIDKEGDVRIAKEVKINNGIDIYISSNKFLKNLGKLIKARFPGIIKTSAKLYTADMQTGKRIYRGTVMFRMPGFRIGDIGMFKGDKVKVMSISNKVMLQDIKTGKKRACKFDEVSKHFRIL